MGTLNIIGNNLSSGGNDLTWAISSAFKARVLSDGGIVESEPCLTSQIQMLKSLGLYDNASLILTPAAYKESKLYSLKPTSGAGDFAFTRAGTAYRKGPSFVETVPYNRVLRSEAFDNASWTKENATVTADNTPSPNGLSTADKILETAFNGVHRAYQSVSKAAVSITYSATVYVKGGLGRDWISLQIDDGVNAAGKFFNITNGTIGGDRGGGTGFTLVSSSIESVGNGWYKCTVVVSSNTATSVIHRTHVSTDGSTIIYLGDVAKGVYLWGAELKVAGYSIAYQPTTDGFNVPRPDYTLGSCPSLLFEPQRTNLLLRSEEFDNAAWVNTNTTDAADTTTAPDGLPTADTLLETNANSIHYIQQTISKAASSLQYAFSVYIKPNGRNWCRIGAFNGVNGVAKFFDIQNGVVGTTVTAGAGFSITASSITNAGNGWYRCAVIITSDATTSLIVTIATATADNTDSYVGDITKGLYLWGGQLEQAANETSYIPTTSATVTRVVDAITTLTGISSLIGQTEGTIFCDFIYPATGLYIALAEIGADVNNRILLDTFSGAPRLFVVVGGAIQAQFSGSALSVGRHKAAVVYKSNYMAMFVDGVKVNEDLSNSVPACSYLKFDNSSSAAPFYGRLNAMVIVPTALTDAQGIAITA